MLRVRRLVAVLALSGAVVTGAVVATSLTVSSATTYVRPPLLCAANGIAVHGPDVWVSGCVFTSQSAFSTRIPAIVEFDARSGSLLKIFKDPDHGNDGPDGIAVAGSRVWVANGDGNTVIELNANSGALVRTINSTIDQFNSPWTITANHSRVWVYNAGNFTITELNASSGSLVRIINAKSDELAGVNNIKVIGSHLWLTNPTYVSNSVVELNASNDSLVKVINAKADDFNLPTAIAIHGSRMWVASDAGPVAKTLQADGARNLPGGSVTELNVNNGSLVKIINAKADVFNQPEGIAAGQSHLWITNGNGNTVTELNALNGSLVRVINSKSDGFGGPSGIVVNGSHVWVLDSAVQLAPRFDVWGGAVTELNALNGSLVRVLR